MLTKPTNRIVKIVMSLIALAATFGGLAAIVQAATSPITAAAQDNTPGWSLSDIPNNNTSTVDWNSVSCASPTFCVAVGQTPGSSSTYEYAVADTYSNGSWGAIQYLNPTSPSASDTDLTSVSCGSSTFCVAVGQNGIGSGSENNVAYVYSDGSWSTPYPLSQASPNNLFIAVSCAPASTVCTAVANTPDTSNSADTNVVAYTYNNGSWGSNPYTLTVLSSVQDDALYISCPSVQFCAATGYVNNGTTGTPLAFTGSGSSWSQESLQVPSGLSGIASLAVAPNTISCTSSAYCMAVENYKTTGGGSQVVIYNYNNGTWSSGTALGTMQSLGGISCGSPTFCVAAGFNGTTNSILTYNGVAWTTVSDSGYNSANSISCPTTSFCMTTNNNFSPVAVYNNACPSGVGQKGIDNNCAIRVDNIQGMVATVSSSENVTASAPITVHVTNSSTKSEIIDAKLCTNPTSTVVVICDYSNVPPVFTMTANTCGNIVPPGDTCSFNVTYSPPTAEQGSAIQRYCAWVQGDLAGTIICPNLLGTTVNSSGTPSGGNGIGILPYDPHSYGIAALLTQSAYTTGPDLGGYVPQCTDQAVTPTATTVTCIPINASQYSPQNLMVPQGTTADVELVNYTSSTMNENLWVTTSNNTIPGGNPEKADYATGSPSYQCDGGTSGCSTWSAYPGYYPTAPYMPTGTSLSACLVNSSSVVTLDGGASCLVGLRLQSTASTNVSAFLHLGTSTQAAALTGAMPVGLTDASSSTYAATPGNNTTGQTNVTTKTAGGCSEASSIISCGVGVSSSSGPVPSGNVSAVTNGGATGACTLTSGSCTFSISSSQTATTVTFIYSGDLSSATAYDVSTDTVPVSGGATPASPDSYVSTTCTPANPPINTATSETCTAVVTSTTSTPPTGTVTWTATNSQWKPQTVGSCKFSTASGSSGSCSVNFSVPEPPAPFGGYDPQVGMETTVIADFAPSYPAPSTWLLSGAGIGAQPESPSTPSLSQEKSADTAITITPTPVTWSNSATVSLPMQVQSLASTSNPNPNSPNPGSITICWRTSPSQCTSSSSPDPNLACAFPPASAPTLTSSALTIAPDCQNDQQIPITYFVPTAPSSPVTISFTATYTPGSIYMPGSRDNLNGSSGTGSLTIEPSSTPTPSITISPSSASLPTGQQLPYTVSWKNEAPPSGGSQFIAVGRGSPSQVESEVQAGMSSGSSTSTCPTGAEGMLWITQTGQSSYSSSSGVTQTLLCYPSGITLGPVSGTGSGTGNVNASLFGDITSSTSQTLQVSAVVIDVSDTGSVTIPQVSPSVSWAWENQPPRVCNNPSSYPLAVSSSQVDGSDVFAGTTFSGTVPAGAMFLASSPAYVTLSIQRSAGVSVVLSSRIPVSPNGDWRTTQYLPPSPANGWQVNASIDLLSPTTPLSNGECLSLPTAPASASVVIHSLPTTFGEHLLSTDSAAEVAKDLDVSNAVAGVPPDFIMPTSDLQGPGCPSALDGILNHRASNPVAGKCIYDVAGQNVQNVALLARYLFSLWPWREKGVAGQNSLSFTGIPGRSVTSIPLGSAWNNSSPFWSMGAESPSPQLSQPSQSSPKVQFIPATVDLLDPVPVSFFTSATILIGNPTATTVTPANQTVTVGTPDSVTAVVTVNGSPITVGTVDFSIGTTTYCVKSLSTSDVTPLCAIPSGLSGLALGNHTVTATYDPPTGGPYAGMYQSSAGTGSIDVTISATATTVTCSPNPSFYGQSVTCAVSVSNGTSTPPTGVVAVTASSGRSCQVTLVSGTGRCSLTGLSVGGVIVIAVYPGNPDNAPSAGSTIETVNRDPTATTVTAHPSTGTADTGTTITAVVTNVFTDVSAAGGTVSIQVGSTTLCTVANVDGTVSCQSLLPNGTETVRATYSSTQTEMPSSGSTIISGTPITHACNGSRCVVRAPVGGHHVPWRCQGTTCKPAPPSRGHRSYPAKSIMQSCPKDEHCVVPTETIVSCSPSQQDQGHIRPVACVVTVTSVYGISVVGGSVLIKRGGIPMMLSIGPTSFRLAPWHLSNQGSYPISASYGGYKISKIQYLASRGRTMVNIGALVCAVPTPSNGVSWWLLSSLPWWLLLLAMLILMSWMLFRRRDNAVVDVEWKPRHLKKEEE